jgi:hypothetical protein
VARQRGRTARRREDRRLKATLDRTAAIDIAWVLTSSDIFLRLVRTRRWSFPRYESWLADTLCEQLLRPVEGQLG